MKKFLVLLTVVLVSVGIVFANGAAEEAAPLDPVQDAINKAQNMTLAELEAAAKAEFEAAGTTFQARNIRS